MHEPWMKLAIGEALLAAEEGEVPVGAVLVRNGEAIICAHNRRERDHDPTAHAELICLREAGRILGDWRLRDCTLYVTLEPCPMCAGAMVMSQLGECVFGAPDERQGCCGSIYDLPGDPALSGRTKWTSGVLTDECSDLMKGFFARRRT